MPAGSTHFVYPQSVSVPYKSGCGKGLWFVSGQQFVDSFGDRHACITQPDSRKINCGKCRQSVAFRAAMRERGKV